MYIQKTETNQDVFDALLIIGKQAESNDLGRAEKLYSQALLWADRCYGNDSPQSGMFLLALMDLFDKLERHADSVLMEDRIRSILVKNADKVRRGYGVG